MNRERNGERKDDPSRRSLLPGMPEEARWLPWRDYVKFRRHFRHLNDEARKLGVTVAELIERRKGVTSGSRLKPFTRTREEVVRIAQAKSARIRHARLLARFAAVVPEPLRGRYEGNERDTMKRWRRDAKKRGLSFEEYVGRLMAAKLAHPDAANPHVFVSMTPKRRAALAAGNEKRIAMAREREEARRAAREEANRDRAAKREIVERQDAGSVVASIVANGRRDSVRRNAATHPWHAQLCPTAASLARAGKPKLAALAAMPAPAQTATTSRFRNCATCAHGGLFKCSAWPSLQARANLVCEHYASDRAAPSARETEACFAENF